MPDEHRIRNAIGRGLILLLAYWTASVVGLQWAAVGGAGSPVWPAAGVGLSGLLLGGIRLWPALLLARLLAGWAVGSQHSLATELVIAGGNAAATVAGALMLQVLRADLRLITVRSAMLLILAAAASALVAALTGSGALAVSAGLDAERTVGMALNWWFGAFVGIVTITPLVLSWWDRGIAGLRLLDALHLVLLLAAITAFASTLFLAPQLSMLRTWHLFPLLIWICLAFQVRGASLALTIVCALAIWGATTGSYFVVGTDAVAARIFYAQQFASMTSLAILVLAAAADERRGKEALQASEERLLNVLESTTDSVLVIDRDWRFTYLNQRAVDQIADGRNLVGEVVWDAFPAAVGGPLWQGYQRAMRTGQPAREEQYVARLGKWFEGNVFPSKDGLTVFFRDITAEREAQAERREGEARMLAVLEQMPIGVSLAEVATERLVFHNAKAKELIGEPLASGERTGARDDTLPGALHDDGALYRAEDYPIFRAVRRGEVVDREPMVFRRRDGRVVRLEVSARPIRGGDGETVLAVSTFEDVAERMKAEEALRRSEDRLALALDVARLGTFRRNLVSGAIEADERYLELYGGPPDVSVAALAACIHEEDRERVAAGLARAADADDPVDEYVCDYRVHGFDGGERWLSERGYAQFVAAEDGRRRAVSLVGAALDITHRKHAEQALAESEVRLRALNTDLERRVSESTEQLVQLQKMESLGQLTGGIAHDFNNLLMAILSSLELLRKRLADDLDPRVERLIDNAVTAARRGSALTQRMLAFARKQDLTPEPVDVAELVAGMGELLKRSLGPRIDIETRFASGTPLALIDANQLELAILNLVVNARDAMEEGGVVTLTVDAAERPGADGQTETWVRLRVQDTGSGMDEATLRRAAEPFFTTKGVGKGTGLGLPMVYGLAEQSGGSFSIESAPGSGTTAEILIPPATAAAGAGGAGSVPERSGSGARSGAARPPRAGLSVLAVDDDPLVLMGTVDMLEDLGHDVVEVVSGQKALELLREGGRFDVILTDQAMPAMTGTQLAQTVRAEFPAIPIVLATGYAEMPKEASDLVAARLGKPFSQSELADVLARVCRARGGSGSRAELPSAPGA